MKAIVRLVWTIVSFALIPVAVLGVAFATLRGDPGVDEGVLTLLVSSTWAILAASIGLPLLLTALAVICGDRRWLLSLVFPPLAIISVIGMACVLVLQGMALIAVIGLYSESHGVAGVGIAFSATLGILATTFALIRASFKMLSPMYIDATGLVLREKDSPRLFDFVGRLSMRLGSPAPSQIILGLEPTFYVTTMPVRLAGTDKPLRGETLYISAPLSRVFAEQELAAVIGHELGHFRGKDTIYSRRFAPAFAALDHAIMSMSGGENGRVHLSAVPALITLGLLYDIFAVNVAKVSRKREIEADRAGAECSTKRDIATALMKATWYDGRWGVALERNASRLAMLDVVENLSEEFHTTERAQPADIATIMQAAPSHPVDSHPPLADRLAALGFGEASFGAADVATSATSAASIIDDLENREAILTQSLHRLMIELRFGSLGERDQRATLVRAAALLGAYFAVQSHMQDAARVRGRETMRDFDTEAFDRFLASSSSLPSLAVMTGVVGSLVSDEGKYVLLSYLDALAKTAPSIEESVAFVRNSWWPK